MDDTETLSALAREALDYRFDDGSQSRLQALYHKIEEFGFELSEIIEVLEKINDKLDEAEVIIINHAFDDDDEST